MKLIIIIFLFASYSSAAQPTVTVYDRATVDSLHRVAMQTIQAKSDSITLLFNNFLSSVQPLRDSVTKHTSDINNLRQSIPIKDTLFFRGFFGTGKQNDPIRLTPL